jgi:hypothetical protein
MFHNSTSKDFQSGEVYHLLHLSYIICTHDMRLHKINKDIKTGYSNMQSYQAYLQE